MRLFGGTKSKFDVGLADGNFNGSYCMEKGNEHGIKRASNLQGSRHQRCAFVLAIGDWRAKELTHTSNRGNNQGAMAVECEGASSQELGRAKCQKAYLGITLSSQWMI